MKAISSETLKNALLAGILCVGVIIVLILVNDSNPPPAPAQAGETEANPAPATASTNAVTEPVEAEAAPSVQTNAVASLDQTNAPAEAPSRPETEANPESEADEDKSEEDDGGEDSDEILVSFNRANVDTVIQWLAETTGKSVLKHPRVNCQLTIVSSKKLSLREALNQVYHALAMEGFTAIETAKSIMIVPKDQEPNLSPALVESQGGPVPEGHQRLVRVFELRHVKAGDLTEKIKGVLSETVKIEADDHANKIIVTDYTDNVRLLGELIKQLDVPSVSDTVVEIFNLEYAEAESLANLLSSVLNEPAESGNARPPGGARPQTNNNAQTAEGTVRLLPDKTSNRLIVTAPKLKIPDIQELVSALDTEKPADVAVRVIPVEHVNAADLVQEIAPLYRRLSGNSLKDIIEVAANTRSNSLVVLSSESNYKAIETLIKKLDTEEAVEQVIRTFRLKNADAEDVAEQLKELNQPTSSSSSRYSYSYYYVYGGTPSSQQKFSVVSDRRRNTVIVQAPPSSMEGIARMIETLDEPVDGGFLAPKIISLKYVSAVDVEEVLSELFLGETQQRDYWDYYYGYPQQDDRDVGWLHGKVRITSEPHSNSIIITSSSLENLAAVEEVVNRLDAPSQAGETTLRVGLNFADAITLANSLNILFAQAGAPPLRQFQQQSSQGDGGNQQQQQNTQFQSNFELQKEEQEDTYFPWLGGQQNSFRSADGSEVRPVSDLIGRVRVVPDPRTNSLLITSNVHFFPQVLKLVNEMDAPTAQVLIEARIIEVSSDFRDRLGVRFSPDGSQTFEADDLDDSILGSGSGFFRNVFTGTALPDAMRSGILESTINLDVLIQFLRKNTDAQVMAEPQINVADNEVGKLFVGAQVPFISNAQIQPQGGRNDAFEYRDVGIILEVTPHINNSDEVALKIRVESSSIRSGETLFGGAILDTRTFHTDLQVNSGQIVVLGGIIQSEDSEVVRKVPLLGSLPLLGWAFKKKDAVTRDVELMVFLRPVITRTADEMRQLVEDMEKATPNIKRWEEEMNRKSAPEPPPR